MSKVKFGLLVALAYMLGSCGSSTTAGVEQLPPQVVLVWKETPAFTPNVYVYRDTKTGSEYVVFGGIESIAVVIRQ